MSTNQLRKYRRKNMRVFARSYRKTGLRSDLQLAVWWRNASIGNVGEVRSLPGLS